MICIEDFEYHDIEAISLPPPSLGFSDAFVLLETSFSRAEKLSIY